MSEDAADRNFMIMVAQLECGSLMALGFVENPVTKEKKKELPQAQMFIDQLDMLRAKTKGNLSAEEEKVIGDAAGRLKMAYVEAVREK